MVLARAYQDSMSGKRYEWHVTTCHSLRFVSQFKTITPSELNLMVDFGANVKFGYEEIQHPCL